MSWGMNLARGSFDSALLNKATRRLREHHLFQMRHEGMTYRQITERVGVSEYTCRRLVRRETVRRSKMFRKPTWP